ncbi:MAG TPA: hypothetical protein DEF36_05765 [Desulfotomaculum sp.]|nr:hypothetical protein [Desulfotomaculum sp.]
MSPIGNQSKRKAGCGRPWAADMIRHSWLKQGDRVRLWPEDTYAKYAVVKETDYYTVTFEIVEVEPGEPHYRPGHRVKLSWSQVFVKME